MARESIQTTDAPASAMYSQGVKVGSHVFVSGMVGIDPSTGELAGPTIQDQTRQALAMNEAYASVFPTNPPARYVAKLGVVLPNVRVSIRMTAIIS